MQRIHYLDNLRAWAMLLGVYLHAAFAYANPAQSVWLATDPGSSRLVDSTIWFIHLFRMSLFFWLSGYFAKLVIQRKGVQTFLLSRLLRIVVPFVLFYPFLLAAIAAVIIFSLSYLESPRGLMGLIAQAAKSSSGDSQSQPLTTMHLWFLYYLMIFSILGVSLSRIDIKRWIPSRIAPWIWLLCPLALLPGVMGTTVPLPAPESFWPHWWPLAFYGLFYLAGWQTRGREEWLQRLQPYTWWIVLASCGLYGLYYFCMPVLDITQLVANEGVSGGWRDIVTRVLTAYLATSLTISALLLGERYLEQRSSLMSFVADASYWIYLVHLPLVLFLQTLLIPLAWPALVKLTIVVLVTMVASMASYVVFVRYTPVGWLLHGRRAFP